MIKAYFLSFTFFKLYGILEYDLKIGKILMWGDINMSEKLQEATVKFLQENNDTKIYKVIDETGHIMPQVFYDKAEAIKFAKKYHCIEVDEMYLEDIDNVDQLDNIWNWSDYEVVYKV